MGQMEFRLLGPVEVVDGSRLIAIKVSRVRTLLAALLLRANHLVTADELIDSLWEEDLPTNPRATVHTYVSRLRRVLPADRDRIRSGPNGYLFDLDGDDLDLVRFRSYVARAQADPDPAGRTELLTSALGLWRGDPLADLPAGPLVHEHRPMLLEEWLRASELLLADQLDLGRHAEILADLGALVHRYPQREQLWALLITALYRNGRQADALHAYQEVRGHLRKHLCREPGTELQDLHQAVLTHSPALAGSAGHRMVGQSPATPVTIPRQLPADLTRFVGRDSILAALDALLPAERSHEQQSIVIAAVDGTAGVGKTALAIHWAHRVAGRFPDGQLYLDLRGYGPSEPLTTLDAAESMLRSINTPVDRIPAGLDSRSALLRTTLAGKRMLVLLDNARDADQVRPLLPGSGSLVLITSRSQLRSLTVREGAHRVTLDSLTEPESTDLLTRVIGDSAVAEPAAVARLARLCGRLPLALALAGERATRAPARPLADLVEDLTDERSRLDLLGGDDEPASDLRVVFSWSYRALPPDAAALFRLIGIAPGPDVGIHAAATLAGLSTSVAQPLLDLLVRANLVECRWPGRFQIHDLLRTYVTEVAHWQDPAAVREAASRRLLVWYSRTAFAARQLLQPAETTVLAAPGSEQVSPLTFETGREAYEWYTAECENLVAAIRLAHDLSYDDLCWRLGFTLWIHFHACGAWERILETQSLGLSAARRLGDRIAEAHMLGGIGAALRGLGQMRDSVRNQREALALFRAAGDENGEATALSNLGVAYRALRRYDEALDCGRQAYALERARGEPGNMAISLLNIAKTLIAAGRHDEAVSHAAESLELFREVGHPPGEGRALRVLATAYGELGQHDRAISHCAVAVTIFTDLGDRWSQASALLELGDLQHAVGQSDAARQTWQQALIILDDLGAPDAAQARARLRQLMP